MKILHYSLGLPPYRTGGLTKYSIDLMKEQVKNNNEVYLLFPGKLNFKETKISYYKNYENIKVYEIINPLPVPLLNGVKEPISFMKKVDKFIYLNFFKSLEVEIVHIHTLMGLHLEFLKACKELNIKVVFTTHDYYGICTKVNFINENGSLCEQINLNKCLKCNLDGSSLKKIAILQSPFYRTIKNIGVIEKIKKVKKNKNNKSIKDKQFKNEVINKKDYEELLRYYNDFLKNIDFFIFNSTVSKNNYRKYGQFKGKVLNITHGDIKDNREIKNKENNTMKIGYMGQFKTYKGIEVLLNVMKELEDKNIKLYLYGDNYNLEETIKNVEIKGSYKQNQLKEIYKDIDLLIVPSLCYETFGFVALEAISNGVPIMVTDRVGSKDLIEANNPFGVVVEANEQSIKKELLKIYKDKEILKNYNNNICKDNFKYSIENHYKEILSIYKDVIF